MVAEIELLESTVSEYRAFLGSKKGDSLEGLDVDSLVRHLSVEHDWTEGGSRAIVFLARDYGIFMLRNALALALALDKQDGDLGF